MKKRKCKVALVVPIGDKAAFYSSCVGNSLNYINLQDVITETPLVTISVRIDPVGYICNWKFVIKSWSSLWYSKDFEL